jgi:hypothetical protein
VTASSNLQNTINPSFYLDFIDLCGHKRHVSQVEPCALEKGVKELLPTVLGNERGHDVLCEVVDIMPDDVGLLTAHSVVT